MVEEQPLTNRHLALLSPETRYLVGYLHFEILQPQSQP